jgi:hypothetical protein
MFYNIKKCIQVVICLVIVILGIWFIGWAIYIEYQNPQTITCEVKDKWVKTYDRGSAYLVKCDNTVYKISDLLFKGKFNSSDIYAALETGKKYEIKTTGYRIKFLSNYQNINKYKEVNE